MNFKIEKVSNAMSHIRNSISIIENRVNAQIDTELDEVRAEELPQQAGPAFDLAVRDIKVGKTIEVGDKVYTPIKKVSGLQLKKGMKVIAWYNSGNAGINVYEILGLSDTDVKYGEGDVKFDSVVQLMVKYDATDLQELEDKSTEGLEYGHSHYLVVKDLVDGESGPWFYIYDNSWCRGPGAEKLRFILVKESTNRDTVVESYEEERRRVKELQAELEDLERREQEEMNKPRQEQDKELLRSLDRAILNTEFEISRARDEDKSDWRERHYDDEDLEEDYDVAPPSIDELTEDEDIRSDVQTVWDSTMNEFDSLIVRTNSMFKDNYDDLVNEYADEVKYDIDSIIFKLTKLKDSLV